MTTLEKFFQCFRATIRSIAAVVIAIVAIQGVSNADPAAMMGCGNFSLSDTADWASQFAALKSAHVNMCRFGLTPDEYWNTTSNTPNLSMDAFMLQAHAAGITPEMLFEYYGNFYPTYLIGPESKWQAIGQAFAARYSPNSAWLKSQGITNWGISIYQAFNEADLTSVWGTIPKNAADPLNAQFGGNYHDALLGLATGVHSVGRNLVVLPGGFATPNAQYNLSLNGYGAAIADLWNNGTLSGMDLHVYNDNQYAPLFPSNNTNIFCAYYLFQQVKQTLSLTADLNFYCTEFNYANPDVQGGATDYNHTATMLLSQIWATLGAVKNDGHTPATKLAFLWSLFPVESAYTTTASLTPYTPYAPAETYQLVASLTSGMTFTSLDPFASGVSTLAGQNKKMWAWIDQPGYTNSPGSTFTVSGFPVGTSSVALYGWDGFNGPRQTLTYQGQSSISFTGLSQGQTYMVVSTPALIKSGLVAWYRLDDASGTVASDSSGNNHAASISGGTLQPASGRFNGSLSFSGSGSAAAMPSNLFVNTGPVLSVSCWFNTSTPGVLVGEQNTPANGGSPTSWAPALYVDSGGYLRGGFYYNNTTNIVTTTTVNDGTWHNAVLVSTGSSQTLYLDGVPVGSVAGGVLHQTDSYNQFGTGFTGAWTNGNGTWSPLNGSMDDVRVYNRALTSAEVAKIAEGAG